MFAGNHQHGIGETAPPVRRFDLLHNRGLRPCHRARHEKREKKLPWYPVARSRPHRVGNWESSRTAPPEALEAHPERELYFTLAVEAQACDLAELASIIHIPVRGAELWSVHQIKKFSAEFAVYPFAKREILTDCKVHRLGARPGKRISR